MDALVWLAPGRQGGGMKRVSLALPEGGLPEPEMLAGGSVYRGAVTLLAGAPEAGKTTLVLFWGKDVIVNDGVVMFIDEEGGKRLTTDRLSALGFTEEEKESIAYYPFPGRSKDGWTRAGWSDLKAELKAVKPDLVIIDSVSRVMAAADMDENSNADANILWDAFIQMARQGNIAVVVLDHVAKNAEDNGYSRGASSKKAASDVVYMLTTVTPFNRQQDGVVKLTVAKDREGYLPRARRLDVLRGPLRFADQDEQPGTWKPTHVMQLCADALTAHERDGGGPVSKTWFTEQKLARKQVVYQAVAALIKDGTLEAAGPVRGNPSYRLRRSEPEAPEGSWEPGTRSGGSSTGSPPRGWEPGTSSGNYPGTTGTGNLDGLNDNSPEGGSGPMSGANGSSASARPDLDDLLSFNMEDLTGTGRMAA